MQKGPSENSGPLRNDDQFDALVRATVLEVVQEQAGRTHAQEERITELLETQTIPSSMQISEVAIPLDVVDIIDTVEVRCKAQPTAALEDETTVNELLQMSFAEFRSRLYEYLRQYV